MNWDWEKLQQRQQDRSRGSGEENGLQTPRMDEVIRKFRNINPSGGWLALVALGVLLALGSSMVYTIASNEVGVVQRFGKYLRTDQPGLHFKLPAGIESVVKVPTKVHTEKFGAEIITENGRTVFNPDSLDASMMLTGDLNVGMVPWIVQFRVKQPYNYLFKVEDVQRLIRDMAEASMRLVVGDRSINEVISNRQEIAIEAMERLQEDLDEADTGISVVTVELGNTNVPQPVQDSFNEVNRAVQEREKMIYQAKKEYNQIIPKARGDAQKTIESAKGYATERINRAKGEAMRFDALYKEYAGAKEVTRRRLYMEMLETVLPGLGDKYIIDSRQNNLLPLLNVGKGKGSQNAGQ